MFEALFVHGLGLPGDPALTDALRKTGFDLKAASAQCPLSIFGACLAAAAQQRYQELLEVEAYRALGTRFVEGILNTMLGKVVGVAVRLSGPDRSLKRIPSPMKSDYGVSVTARLVESRHYQISSVPGLPAWAGPFFLGLFEEALRRTRVSPKSEISAGKAPGSFVLDIRWPASG